MTENNETKLKKVTLASGETANMKLLQNIYNEITGKTESLSKRLTDNHIINFESIEQLNYKICQLYEQYNIIGKNCSVTIYHINDSKETFSSFERFKIYNKSSTSPTENVNINYKFLIKLPETDRTQTYELSINLHSRTAIREKTSKETSLPFNLIRILPNTTGNYKIEYVDYTVARTFKHAIDEWYDTINKNHKNKLLGWFQDHSRHSAWILRAITSSFLVWNFYIVAENHVLESSSLNTIFPLAIFGFGTIFISAQIAFQIGLNFERLIDSIQPISTILLNSGDDTTISKYKNGNLKNIFGLFISAIGSISLGIMSSLIISYFGLL